jgi:hypothetical protein
VSVVTCLWAFFTPVVGFGYLFGVFVILRVNLNINLNINNHMFKCEIYVIYDLFYYYFYYPPTLALTIN